MQRYLKDSLLAGVLLAGAFALFTVGALFFAQFHAFPSMSNLAFNGYSILSITSAVGSFIILLKIISGNSHSEETGWFMLVLLGQIMFAGGEALQRCSLDPSAVIFWAKISGSGAAILGIALLLFTISYTRPARLRATIMSPFFLWAATVVIAFYAGTSLIFNTDPSQLKHFPWGYNNDAGPAFWVMLIWIVLPALSAGILQLRFRKRSDHPLLRKQSFLYAMAILIPAGTAAITDVLLPLFDINIIPPLSTATELVTCVVIYYGTTRFQFFQINPAVLAENVLSTMSEAVVVTKADFSIEYINNEAQKLLGLEKGNLSSTYMHTLFSPESWGKINEFIQGGGHSVFLTRDFGEITIVDKKGKQTPVRALISGLQEGTFHAYIFVITNISDIVASYRQLEEDANRIRALLEESHRLQHQLQVEKDSVEQVVEVRTRELRQAQEKLKEADKLKTEFIMLGSHNLRTPITIMSSSLELLKTVQGEEDRTKLLGTFDQGITRLREFVEEMVEIANLESGSSLPHEPTTINELLSPLLDDAAALAATKPTITFETSIQDSQVSVMANVNRLRGALNNLIGNAFKFTENGQVRVAGEVRDDNYCITVEDTGIGMPAEELPMLFTKFHRGTDTMRFQYEGKGIGLYLSKLIITEHGGDLTAESTPNVGSKFTVLIPISKAKETQTTPDDKVPEHVDQTN